MHEGDALGEEAREHAEAWADLEHDIGRIEQGEPFDHAEDVRIDEKVLPERLPRPDGHSPKTASALASICAVSVAGSTPRASARAR